MRQKKLRSECSPSELAGPGLKASVICSANYIRPTNESLLAILQVKNIIKIFYITLIYLRYLPRALIIGYFERKKYFF